MSALPEGFFERVAELRAFITAGMQGGLGVIQDLELTMSQALALFHLADHGRLSVGDLQAAIGRSQAATSHLVDQLTQRSLVRRRTDPSDRRRRVVELAPRGRAAMRKIEAMRRTALERALAPVPSDVIERYDAAMAEVLGALRR
jgi:DNA-binding MarR family transcriptional regulator